MMKRYFLAAAAALALATPASAAQIVMNGSNIVGATAGFNDLYFSAANIFNNQSGAIPQENAFDGSFWLARGVSPTAFITIDLGAFYSDLSFDFFNTHNGQSFDRGIGGFEIFASDRLTSAGADGQTLAGDIRRLVSGTLAAEDDTIEAQTFAANNAAGYRYIQLRPTSVASTGKPNNDFAYGLNELRIYGEAGGLPAVPEPGTWALMIIGFGMAGAALRRRALAA